MNSLMLCGLLMWPGEWGHRGSIRPRSVCIAVCWVVWAVSRAVRAGYGRGRAPRLSRAMCVAQASPGASG